MESLKPDEKLKAAQKEESDDEKDEEVTPNPTGTGAEAKVRCQIVFREQISHFCYSEKEKEEKEEKEESCHHRSRSHSPIARNNN